MIKNFGGDIKVFHINKNHIFSPLKIGGFKLFQIGRLYCTPDTEVSEHAHIGWFELTIVTEGRGRVITNGVPIEVKKGDIYLSFPCDFHGIVADRDDPLKYDFVSFATDDKEMSEDLQRIMDEHMPADRRLINDDSLRALVGISIAELDSGDPYSERMMEALLTEMVIRLIRCFICDTPHQSEVYTESEALCYRIMNYIDTHIYTMNSLSEISELTNYNYSYLSALFKRTTSGTMADYYRKRRLETARLLIIENKLKITQVASILHYSSIYTFSRAFKDQYGVSPEQYKCEKLRK